jgi:hypothetical protein
LLWKKIKYKKTKFCNVNKVKMDDEELYVPDDVLEEASAAKWQNNVVYKITPERIRKIYTMADRETNQRDRRK